VKSNRLTQLPVNNKNQDFESKLKRNKIPTHSLKKDDAIDHKESRLSSKSKANNAHWINEVKSQLKSAKSLS